MMITKSSAPENNDTACSSRFDYVGAIKEWRSKSDS